MSSEEPQVEGKFIKQKTTIKDPDMIHALEIKGYGENQGNNISKKQFILSNFESLYLVYVGRLALKRNDVLLDFENLIQIYKKDNPDILTKFLIYRDLRVRGYVVKDGFGFGTDFRVYERGQFGEKGAKYVVFALNEGEKEKVGAMYKKIADITHMGKEPIIAVLERRGEVIYYKISLMNFTENKFAKKKIEF